MDMVSSQPMKKIFAKAAIRNVACKIAMRRCDDSGDSHDWVLGK